VQKLKVISTFYNYSVPSLSPFIFHTNLFDEDINTTKKKNTKFVLFSCKEVVMKLNADNVHVSLTECKTKSWQKIVMSNKSFENEAV
jgi:hypothetical protein